MVVRYLACVGAYAECDILAQSFLRFTTHLWDYRVLRVLSEAYYLFAQHVPATSPSSTPSSVSSPLDTLGKCPSSINVRCVAFWSLAQCFSILLLVCSCCCCVCYFLFSPPPYASLSAERSLSLSLSLSVWCQGNSLLSLTMYMHPLSWWFLSSLFTPFVRISWEPSYGWMDGWMDGWRTRRPGTKSIINLPIASSILTQLFPQLFPEDITDLILEVMAFSLISVSLNFFHAASLGSGGFLLVEHSACSMQFRFVD